MGLSKNYSSKKSIESGSVYSGIAQEQLPNLPCDCFIVIVYYEAMISGEVK